MKRYETTALVDLIFERLWLSLKRISVKKTYLEKFCYTTSITFTHKIWGLTRIIFGESGVIETAEREIGDFIVE
jgi:hypothetical protein